MAGFERFNKRWASNGQLETITDNNAALGLAFLGNATPSAELHNQMFQWLDDKDNYLFTLLNEVVKERTGTQLDANTMTKLASAIATAATTTKAGIQRNSTGPETLALSASDRTVTPASLKPLIDGLVLGIANSVPSGGVLAFARSSAPAGWVAANGQAISRADNIDLFNAIGTTFGAGNGSTTFNVPNINGAVVRGWNPNATGVDGGRGFGSLQAASNQAHTHGLTIGAVAAHTHGFTTAGAGAHSHTNSVAAEGAHTHTASSATAGNHTHGASSGAAGTHNHTGTTVGAGNHTHSASSGAAGNHAHGASADTQGNHIHVTSISGDGTYTPIYGWTAKPAGISLSASHYETTHSRISNTSAAGAHSHTITVGAAGNHAHTVSVAAVGDHAHTFTTTTIGNHTHTVAVTAAGDHTHGITVNAVGGHTHAVTINGVGDHTHSGTTAAAGAFTPSVTMASEGGEARMYNIALLYCIKL